MPKLLDRVALIRETAYVLRDDDLVDVDFDGEHPNAAPWEYAIAWQDGLYRLSLTRWTRYVNLPGSLYEAPEIGWYDPETKEFDSPILATLFDRLDQEGLPLPTRQDQIIDVEESGAFRLPWRNVV